MTYVIAGGCVDLMDRSCVEVCPVDCIYVGDRKLYINPAECIECGACEPECPVEAIVLETFAGPEEVPHVEDNAAFFHTVLPGRDAPLGDPGGASAVGAIAADTPLVAALPARET
ncbi:ferredoxin [Pseudonocardia endophytica]|uniref:Ferredoxin n=1 Tax=Pseudonocardia endophytica TaxID=401976 RepID=A0A4R1HMG7_PSEEN|nr:ferredoxin [Pseudonocardia endophytica]TCK22233.1 NAD-dependent dihydropyrimidine dehydrogenase PreA subunit [Pseudonocardia endophytica]